MNWQEWVVGLLIVLCVARILYGIYLFFRRVKENDNPCASCASGCELKDMMEKKQKECSSKKKNTKKMVSSLVDESIFKLITNPLYFNETYSWQNRRKLLLEMCGDISDEDVIASHDELRRWLNC